MDLIIRLCIVLINCTLLIISEKPCKNMIYSTPDIASFDFSNAVVADSPFLHFSATSVLNDDTITRLYNWFLTTTEWHLVETNFYEQYEFSLLAISLPADLKILVSDNSLSEMTFFFKEKFNVKSLEIVDVVAHKLVNSQHIGVHNDYIDEEETHRMVLHVN